MFVFISSRILLSLYHSEDLLDRVDQGPTGNRCALEKNWDSRVNWTNLFVSKDDGRVDRGMGYS